MRTLAAAVRFSAWAARPPETQRLDEGALLSRRSATLTWTTTAPSASLTRWPPKSGPRSAPSTRLLRPSQLARRDTALRVLEAINETLIARHGFHGADDDYHNPRNSFLNEALERREGLPITLSVIYLEIARRLGAPLEGVGLPAHFMVRWPLPADEGGAALCGCLPARRAPRRAHHAPVHPAPAPRPQLARLRPRLVTRARYPPDPHPHAAQPQAGLSHTRRDWPRAGGRGPPDRAAPRPPEELRDRGLLRLAMGEPLLAAADIAAYLERAPNAPEGGRLRRRIQSVREVRAKLN